MSATVTEGAKSPYSKLIHDLSLTPSVPIDHYVAPSNEDYKALVRAALDGELEGVVSVGRSGIYLNHLRVDPPLCE